MVVKLIVSSTSIVVLGVFALVLAWKRDAFVASFWLGAISNGILSKVLKKIINQARTIASITNKRLVMAMGS